MTITPDQIAAAKRVKENREHLLGCDLSRYPLPLKEIINDANAIADAILSQTEGQQDTTQHEEDCELVSAPTFDPGRPLKCTCKQPPPQPGQGGEVGEMLDELIEYCRKDRSAYPGRFRSAILARVAEMERELSTARQKNEALALLLAEAGIDPDERVFNQGGM